MSLARWYLTVRQDVKRLKEKNESNEKEKPKVKNQIEEKEKAFTAAAMTTQRAASAS
jgi:hypothetical protein